MQKYSEFSPTSMDPKGLALDDRQDWEVLPVSRNRDTSSAFALANWASACEQLPESSDNVEIHRFGHWANGWFEIIIVKPNTPEYKIALDIESCLADYPVLDDEKCSEIELEQQNQSWENWDCRVISEALENEICELIENDLPPEPPGHWFDNYLANLDKEPEPEPETLAELIVEKIESDELHESVFTSGHNVYYENLDGGPSLIHWQDTIPDLAESYYNEHIESVKNPNHVEQEIDAEQLTLAI